MQIHENIDQALKSGVSGECCNCGTSEVETGYGYICGPCVTAARRELIEARGGTWCEACEASGLLYEHRRQFCSCVNGKRAEQSEREFDLAEAREYRRLSALGIY